jgi:hypothetical protein
MLYVGLRPKAEKALAILIQKYGEETAEELIEEILCEALSKEEQNSIGWSS